MVDRDLQKYIDYKVSNVKSIKGKFGFIVTLFYDDGTNKIIQKSGFPTKKAANAARDKTLGELVTHTFIVNNSLKVCNFLNDWLENIMRPKIAYNTYCSYRNAIKHINNAIGSKNLTLVKPSTLDKLYKDYAKISYSVTQLMKVVLDAALAYATRNQLINVNPALDTVFPSQPKYVDRRFRTRSIAAKNTLDAQQLKYLIDSSKGKPIYLHILFATLLGLRKSEINGLRYTDIDYVNRTIAVKRQIGKKLARTPEEQSSSTKEEVSTKTLSSVRVVPLPDVLFEAILEQRQWYEKQRKRRKSIFKDLEYICCCYNGNPRSRGYVYTPFKKLLKDCGLPDMKWHDLRTSYCSMLLKENFNPKAVSVLMGHAKEIITVDVYGDNKLIGDCLEVLEPFIEEMFKEDENRDLLKNSHTLDYSSQILEEFLEPTIIDLLGIYDENVKKLGE